MNEEEMKEQVNLWKLDNTPVGPFLRVNFDHPEMIKGIQKIMNRKIVEYQYVSGVWDNIERMVSILIADGWQPIGGISVTHTPDDDRCWYAQAMVKYE